MIRANGWFVLIIILLMTISFCFFFYQTKSLSLFICEVYSNCASIYLYEYYTLSIDKYTHTRIYIKNNFFVKELRVK